MKRESECEKLWSMKGHENNKNDRKHMRLQTHETKEVNDMAVKLAELMPPPGTSSAMDIEKSILKAGELAAETAKRYPNFIDVVVESNPLLFSREFVRRLIALGQKKITPELFCATHPGARALAKLPYDAQEKYLKEPLPVVLQNGDTLLVDLHNLSALQVRQVFDGDRIRSEGEQRAWIENQKLKNSISTIPHDVPWRVVGDEIVFMEPGRITIKEAARIVSEAMK